MGSGASRINSAPHDVIDRRSFEHEFNPSEESKFPPGDMIHHNHPDQGRNRIKSDPSVKYQPLVKKNEKNSIISRGANLIFSPLLSPPTEEVRRGPKKSGLLQRGEHSHRRAEKRYWLDGDAHVRHASWNELQISALIAKPFTGQVRTIASKKHHKMKHVRTIAVARSQGN